MIDKIFSELPSRDIFSLLDSLGAWIKGGAESIRISPAILFAVALVLAVGVGLTCYRLMKVWMALLGAVAGYYLTGNGLVLFNAGSTHDVPMLLVYVLAILVAAGMLFLAFKSPSYVFYTVMAVAGFGMVYFYLQNLLFSFVGALVLALLCAFFMRVSFIVVSSFVGGTLSVSFLGALLPNVGALQLEVGNWTAIGAVVGLFAVFTLFQFLVSARRRKDKAAAPKPVKQKAEASLFSF